MDKYAFIYISLKHNRVLTDLRDLIRMVRARTRHFFIDPQPPPSPICCSFFARVRVCYLVIISHDSPFFAQLAAAGPFTMWKSANYLGMC